MRTALGLTLFLAGIAYVAGAVGLLHEQPNVWLAIGLVGAGAYLLDPADVGQIAEKVKGLRG